MNIFTTLLIQPLANGLIIFYDVLGRNLGLAIIGFSLFLRLILNPLTKPYMESMKKMKDIAPQLEKLKARHKGDKIKFMQAQSDLYKEKGINPGAGCLPYLLQIVVLIAFFNVFTRVLVADGNPVQRFNELLYTPLKFDQNEILNTQFIYLNITKPDCFGPGNCISNPLSLSFPIPGPVLILAALIQFISAKVMTPYTKLEEKVAKGTKETADDFQVAMQKSMSYTFPLFTLLIGMKFASGLALYWLIFSLTQTLQQVKMQGWGELTPYIKKLGLIKNPD